MSGRSTSGAPPSVPRRDGGDAEGRDTGGDGAVPVDWEALARAHVHPIRISILEVLGIDGGRTLSPSELSHELQQPLGTVNYHVTGLCRLRLVRLVRRRPVRGATENFYRLSCT